MSSSSSSGNKNDSSGGIRKDHNQGRQSRDFTPAQEAAVNRVRKCKHTEYYAILDLETGSATTESDIKRAYRKLALIMHPDKNGAPGADEAFKMVSKAFQILSDPSKRSVYDQTGQDPESRSSAAASSASGFGSAFSSGGARQGGFGPELSPEDLFNMFFGGGGHPAFSSFGGPGIRVQTFGGSPFGGFGTHPGFRQRRRAPAGHANGNANSGNNNNNNNTAEPSLQSLIQLLPLIILFVLPLLSNLFMGGEAKLPTYHFRPVPPHYTVERMTPKYSVPYYVSNKEIKDMPTNKLRQMDRKVESKYVTGMQYQCENELEMKRQKLRDADGWFFRDQDKYDAALNLKMPACERLQDIGIRLPQ